MGTVGKGVFSGVRHVVPGASRRNTATTLHDGAADGYAVQDRDHGQDGGNALMAPQQSRTSDVNGRIAYSPVGGGSPDFGQLQVTVTEIQGVPQDEKVRVQLLQGSKHHEKAHIVKNPGTGHNDVIFNVKTLPEAMNLTFSLVIKKAFGKDKPLGSAEMDIWSLIHPGVQNAADTVLNTGAGDIAVSLVWTASANSAGNAGSASPTVSRSIPQSASGGTQSNVPESPASVKSKSRFSMHRKRENTPSN